MFWLGFGFYTVFMVLVFGFFIIAKIHVYKFRHYSTAIEPVTKVLALTLLVLALAGYYLLFSGTHGTIGTQTVQETADMEIY